MLEVKNLSKRYGEKQALRSVSFSIQGREAVGFLGINGAGKTTTMNILTGYISASDGDVVIDGIDVLTDPLKAKTRIGYLPEQPPVYGDMRVDEYLNFIYQLKKVKKNKAIRQDREEYLQGIMELVGITDVAKRMIRNLSKGYKQRVGLAQALIGDPEILILDEPTVGLDPAQIIEIRQLICDLAKTRTVLLSSHILSEVQAVCDRIIILHQGKIVADGRTEQLADQVICRSSWRLRATSVPCWRRCAKSRRSGGFSLRAASSTPSICRTTAPTAARCGGQSSRPSAGPTARFFR